MVLMFRGRSSRPGSSKEWQKSSGCSLNLDYRKGQAEIVNEVLECMTRYNAVKWQKLGAYNAFVQLCTKFGNRIKASHSADEIAVCLRQGLFNPAKEIRAACLRSFRYYCCSPDAVAAIVKLHIDYLIARSLDICLDNDIERLHAIRLIRKMISVCPQQFPSSLVTVLVSVAQDGLKEQDKMTRSCLAAICELEMVDYDNQWVNDCFFAMLTQMASRDFVEEPIALSNASLVSRHGGIKAILGNILSCHHLHRINESLVATSLCLINVPNLRLTISPQIDLQLILAPFTDVHYKYGCEHVGEDNEFNYDPCRMALSTVLKSWPGIFHLCSPTGTGLKSLIDMLKLSVTEMRNEIIDALFDVFRLPIPEYTSSFTQALQSTEKAYENWQLGEGFIAEEGKFLLRNLAKTRPNLVDNHSAVVLSIFIQAGLFEALAEVICTGDIVLCVRATILLGKLLRLGSSCFPESRIYSLQCLPSLIERATSFKTLSSTRDNASRAINFLRQMDVNNIGSMPLSIYLEHQMLCIQQSMALRSTVNLLQLSTKDRENEQGSQLVRDTQVLYSKDHHSWNWRLISTILKGPDDAMRNLEDESSQRFISRILNFFKPSSKVYSVMESGRDNHSTVTQTGLDLMDFFVDTHADFADKCLQEFLKDITSCLSEILEQKTCAEGVFTTSSLLHTCSQYYFLFIGHLSMHKRGQKYLDELCVYQILLEMMDANTHELYVKLSVSCLDYTHDGPTRAVLSRALTATSENSRLYSTKFFRVLLRAMASSEFTGWGLPLLVSQLKDSSKRVAMEALSILSEACEEQVHLQSLCAVEIPITCLGFKGDQLLARLMSYEHNFHCLFSDGVVSQELSKWHMIYNLTYVDAVDECLSEALTTYERTFDSSYVRRSYKRCPRRDVLVPVHLYGQLSQHEAGSKLLASLPYLNDTFSMLQCDNVMETSIKRVKAALWASGHIGRSVWGIELLNEKGVVADVVKLAETAEVYSVRGTAVFVVGMLSSTKRGADIVQNFGWESVRRSRDGGAVHHQLNVHANKDSNSYCDLSAAADSDCRFSADRPSFVVASDAELSGFMNRPHNKKTRGSSYCETIGERERPGSLTENLADLDIAADDAAVTTGMSSSEPGNNSKCVVECDDIQNCYSDKSNEAATSWNSNESCGDGGGGLLSDSVQFVGQVEIRKRNATVDGQPPVESSSAAAVRSSLTLPVIMRNKNSTTAGTEQRQVESMIEHVSSARDMSGYVQLRGLRQSSKIVSTILSTAESVASQSVKSAASYKTRSLDYRASRLRASLRSLVPKRHISMRLSLPGSSSARLRKSAMSADRVDLFSNANAVLASRQSSCNVTELTAGQAEYIGISLPSDINRLFPAGPVRNTSTVVSECQVVSVDEACGTPQLKSNDAPYSHIETYSLERHNVQCCLGCFRIYQQQGDATITITFSPVHQEILRLVIKMGSSIGTKSCEHSLLVLKQNYISYFQEICLYSEICSVLASYNFRLNSRRFIQELFQDVDYRPCLVDPCYQCGILEDEIPTPMANHIEDEF